jgi:transposase-like protein
MALSVNVEAAFFAASLFVTIETVGVNLVTVKVWLKNFRVKILRGCLNEIS